MYTRYTGFLRRDITLIARNLKTANDKKFNLPGISEVKSILEKSRNFEIIKSSYDKLGNSLQSKFDSSVDKFSLVYDRITGRDVVRKTGVELLQAEQAFLNSQLQRRTLQQSLFDIQNKRKEISKQLDVVSRTHESFITLVVKEHELAREEAKLFSEHQEADFAERAAYEKFTGLMRHLNMEERNYDRRVRQWTLIGSVVAGFFSVLIAWIRFHSNTTKDREVIFGMIESIQTTQKDIVKQLAWTCGALKGNERTQNVVSDIGLPNSIKKGQEMTRNMMEGIQSTQKEITREPACVSEALRNNQIKHEFVSEQKAPASTMTQIFSTIASFLRAAQRLIGSSLSQVPVIPTKDANPVVTTEAPKNEASSWNTYYWTGGTLLTVVLLAVFLL